MTKSDILCYIVSHQPSCSQEQKEEVQGIIRSHNNGHDRGGDAGPEGEPLFQVALYFHFQHHFPFLHFLFSALFQVGLKEALSFNVSCFTTLSLIFSLSIPLLFSLSLSTPQKFHFSSRGKTEAWLVFASPILLLQLPPLHR